MDLQSCNPMIEVCCWRVVAEFLLFSFCADVHSSYTLMFWRPYWLDYLCSVLLTVIFSCFYLIGQAVLLYGVLKVFDNYWCAPIWCIRSLRSFQCRLKKSTPWGSWVRPMVACLLLSFLPLLYSQSAWTTSMHDCFYLVLLGNLSGNLDYVNIQPPCFPALQECLALK